MNRRHYSELYSFYSHWGIIIFLIGVGIAFIIVGLKSSKTKRDKKLSLILGSVFIASGIYAVGVTLNLWSLRWLMHIFGYIFPASLTVVGIMLIVKGIKTKCDRYPMITFGAFFILIGIAFFAGKTLLMIWYMIKYLIPSELIITGIILMVKGIRSQGNKHPMVILGTIITFFGAALFYTFLTGDLHWVLYLLKYGIPSALIITGIILTVKGIKAQRDKIPMIILGSVLILIGGLLLAIFLSGSIKWLADIFVVFEIILIPVPAIIGTIVIKRSLRSEKDKYPGLITAALLMLTSISMLMSFLKMHGILTASFNFFRISGLTLSAALITGGIILSRNDKNDKKAAGVCLIAVGIMAAAISFDLPIYRLFDLLFLRYRW